MTRELAWARIWLDWVALASPRAWAMVWPHADCQASQRASSGSASSARSGDSSTSAASAARACPSARAEVSRPPVPTAPECDRTSVAGPARRSESSTSTPCRRISDGARGLERRQGERRADLDARPVRRQRDEHLAAVVERAARHDEVRPRGARDPRHRPVEPVSSGPGLDDPDRLGAQPSRGGQVRDPDGGDGFSSTDGAQPALGRGIPGRGQQATDRGVVLREDESRAWFPNAGRRGFSRSALLLFFIALTYHPSPPKLILLEEPENGVHPRRLADVLRLLKEITRGEHGQTPAGGPDDALAVFTRFGRCRRRPGLVFHRRSDGRRTAQPVDEERLKLFLDEFMLGEVWYNQGEAGLVAK